MPHGRPWDTQIWVCPKVIRLLLWDHFRALGICNVNYMPSAFEIKEEKKEKKTLKKEKKIS